MSWLISSRYVSAHLLRPAPPLAILHLNSNIFSRCYTTKRYTREHEWVGVEDSLATVGITDHAQISLGEVVYVETPALDRKVKKQESIGAIESVKAASDVYAPVSGDVVLVNEKLGDYPALINKSPENEGWLCKIKMSDPSEIDGLLDAEAYEEFIAAEK
ncbi:5107_t:CDS:2 [Ambispora gerdemannii]|uniref:Glycine cleavage system H protein n=1 Tax=Ambispora gerdemannii TaxID=144530 RepID=A0A9N8ZMR2_9GLOM|nr:5107_t:CDS:2 [Ambispora gerdemannii]